tara:strand:- start:253 stop:1266 length:1014 start_codon:yes stop_codon:yes gene_type:complete
MANFHYFKIYNNGKPSLDISSSFERTGIFPLDRTVWKRSAWCLEEAEKTRERNTNGEVVKRINTDESLCKAVSDALQSGHSYEEIANSVRRIVAEDESFYVFLAKQTVIAEKETQYERKKRLLKKRAPRLSSGGRGFLVKDTRARVNVLRATLLQELDRKEEAIADVTANIEAENSKIQQMEEEKKKALAELVESEAKLLELKQRIEEKKIIYLEQNPNRKRATMDTDDRSALDELIVEAAKRKKELKEMKKNCLEATSNLIRVQKQKEKLEKRIKVIKGNVLYKEQHLEDQQLEDEGSNIAEDDIMEEEELTSDVEDISMGDQDEQVSIDSETEDI